jgi:hypothetical protein
MANEAPLGFKGKVTLGSTRILGMGTWTIAGITRAVLDASEFTDLWRKNRFGRIDPGQVTFNGLYIPDDAGTESLIEYLYSGADVTDIQLHFDNDTTSGFFAPNSTTAAHGYLPAESPIGYMTVINTSWPMDQNDLGRVSFTGQMSGALARYNADGSIWEGV